MTFIFRFIYGIILPIDELIFFKMVIAPPTRLLFGRYTTFGRTPSAKTAASQPRMSHESAVIHMIHPPMLLTTMNHKVP